MDNLFFEHPILNSPYEYPARHWELDTHGQPTQQIVENLRKLTATQAIVSPAFEMDVVERESLSWEIDGAYQRNSAAYSTLEWLHARNKPSWKPESRLTMKSENARVQKGKSGERRLPMIGRHRVVSLGKLFKLASKYVVHCERLRDLLRDIAAMSSPGVQIGFLQ